MKITCSACGAKYTIADEKVQGKRVKVRCKSCKASILVDGTGGAGGEGDADEAVDEPADLGKAPALSLGPVLPGTGLINPKSGEAPAPESAKKPPERKPGKKNAWSVNLTDDDSREMTTDELVQGWKDGVVTSDAYVWKDGMDDWKPILEVPELKLRLKAITPPGAAAPAKEAVVTSAGRPPAARAPQAPAASADLFGGADFGSGSPAAAAGGPPVAGDDKKPTGARNESSVLFSLDALKAPAPAEKEDRRPGEDLFAGLGGGLGGGGLLGGSADLLTAPAKDPPPAPAGVRAAPVLTAPVADAPSKGKGGLIAAAVLGIAVLGGGAFFLTRGGDDGAAAQATAEAEAKAKASAEAAEAEKKKIEEEKKKVEEEKKKLEEQLKAAQDAATKKEEPTADAKKEEPTAATTPATGSTPTTGTKPADKPAAPAASAGAFDTAAAKAALSSAAAGAGSCAQPGGPTGSGKVEVTFAPSGRVTSANVVSGPFGGTPVGGCIASTFRRARVPAFSGAPVTVAKSFSVK